MINSGVMNDVELHLRQSKSPSLEFVRSLREVRYSLESLVIQLNRKKDASKVRAE